MTAAESRPARHETPTIGVLCLETRFTKIPGHIRNPRTFDFPVLYQVVQGATPERVVSQSDPRLIEPFCQAARELEARGAAAITSGCGFLVLFQQQLAAAVSIPVFASSLIQLPMVHRMLLPEQRVGLLVAKKEALTARHLAAIGAQDVPISVVGLADQPEFREVMLEGRRVELNEQRLEAEVLEVIDGLARDTPELGALILECTDVVPFAQPIQQRLGVPVFDIVTLTNSVHASLSRRRYH
ncbi:MAG TPA: aspartate/glutamate racemase family protein [Jatrophihabitans sp.]|nr:aspartate/glutamate racemase family protein [Jatrophihabitans sp.]